MSVFKGNVFYIDNIPSIDEKRKVIKAELAKSSRLNEAHTKALHEVVEMIPDTYFSGRVRIDRIDNYVAFFKRNGHDDISVIFTLFVFSGAFRDIMLFSLEAFNHNADVSSLFDEKDKANIRDFFLFLALDNL